MSRRLLQLAIAVLALLPVGAGLAGFLSGAGFLGLSGEAPRDLDSHLRFLSGVFLVLGVAWWSCIPAIETKGERMRLLGAATIVGGLARLSSIFIVGTPSTGHMIGLVMELVVVPLLLVWQTRIAR